MLQWKSFHEDINFKKKKIVCQFSAVCVSNQLVKYIYSTMHNVLILCNHLQKLIVNVPLVCFFPMQRNCFLTEI